MQQEVGSRLFERLDLLKLVPRIVMDIGCGPGKLSVALARRYRRARVIALDIAHGMLRVARRRAPWLRRPALVCGDAESLPFAAGSSDLLFSNLTLQWCNDLERTLAEFRRVLRPGGALLLTTLGPDTLRELRASWAEVDSRTHVHLFLDMHDIGDAMVRAGLAEPVLDVERFTLSYPDVYRLMRDLKGVGAHNVATGRAPGLTGRCRLRAMAKAYEAYRGAEGLPATYEVIYAHAWGAPGGGDRERRAEIPIASLRRQGSPRHPGSGP